MNLFICLHHRLSNIGWVSTRISQFLNYYLATESITESICYQLVFAKETVDKILGNEYLAKDFDHKFFDQFIEKMFDFWWREYDINIKLAKSFLFYVLSFTFMQFMGVYIYLT